eukprot:TRINITY_DN15542_c0_g1_i1.p1 TRINITY_DN15542_c0_g1~~TRINITY_DN15542_c0_g1_i1.p1  ORF type:complete len:372 (+),score=75.11 TRINITY_DN15542_c0_g1_i1:69-1184(+)
MEGQGLIPALSLGGNDAIKRVWKYLEAKDVAACMRVNKSWRSHFGSDEIWKEQASKLNFASLLMEKYQRRGTQWRSFYPQMLAESKHSIWLPIKHSIEQYSRNRSRLIRAINEEMQKQHRIKLITEILGAWTWWIPATEYHDWTRTIDAPRMKGTQVARTMDGFVSYFKELDATFTKYQNPEDVQQGIHEILLVVTPTCDAYVWNVQESSAFAIIWYFEWIAFGLSPESRDRQLEKLDDIFHSVFSSYHVSDLPTILEAEDRVRVDLLENAFDAKYGRDLADEMEKGRFGADGCRIDQTMDQDQDDDQEVESEDVDTPIDEEADAPSHPISFPPLLDPLSDNECERGCDYDIECLDMGKRAYILAKWDRKL